MKAPAVEHKVAHLAFAPKRLVLPDWWQVARMNPGVARRQLMTQILLRRRSEGDTFQGVSYSTAEKYSNVIIAVGYCNDQTLLHDR